MFASKDALFAKQASSAYQISRSLRFRSSASAYLSRTPASAGNRTTWTWSGWVKRGALGVSQWLLDADNGSTDSTEFNFAFNSSNALSISGSLTTWRVTTQVFRDVGAWYHILLAVDTTQATANNRIRLYVNGAEITAFSTLNNPTQNLDLAVNQAITHYLGIRTGLTSPLDGYLAEVNFIDGQALTPSSFGAFDTNGVWQPARYTGSYGTNGFYLNFSDNSGATATTIGKDSSGNSNNWTPNNISVTAGAGNDSMIDTPTPYADGGNGRGNYATFNPIRAGAQTGGAAAPVLSNGNLTAGLPSSGYGWYLSTIAAPSTGYWYAEFTMSSGTYNGANNHAIGLLSVNNTSSVTYLGAATAPSGYAYLDGNITTGSFRNNGVDAQSVAGYQVGDTIMIAFGNGKVWWGKNGTWLGTGSPNPATATSPAYSGLTGDYFIVAQNYASPYGYVIDGNFGQRAFAYTPPSGFSALNTQNLPTPTIAAGNKYFDINLITGNGGVQSVTGVGFQPDFVWWKGRSNTGNHILSDAVRGAGNFLRTNLTDAEASGSGMTSFNADGFSVNGSYNSGYTFVNWMWKGGNGTSNIAVNAYGSTPSIASTVSANTSAGFSVVTYTGTGANATVGHGLGVAPSMLLVKKRSAANSWQIYHSALGATKVLSFDTAAAGTDNTVWNGGSPTFNSTVFSLGTENAVNGSGSTFVCYAWTPIAGYSAFGSYTGNGSADGPFIFTGFRPRWIMGKCSSAATSDWFIYDTSRATYNASTARLYADTSGAETTGLDIDILSNGFKFRALGGQGNDSGSTYIYAAFAETPFKFSRSR